MSRPQQRLPGESISTHDSLRGEERRPCAVRYDGGSVNSSVDILILVQVWSSDQRWDGIIISKATYAEGPRILLFNWMLSRWANSITLHVRTPHTRTILGGIVLALLVRRHIWLKSRAKVFCNGWDLENDEPLKLWHVWYSTSCRHCLSVSGKVH